MTYLDRSLGAGFRPGMGRAVPDRLFWAHESEGQAGLGPGRLLQLRQAGVRQVIADVGGPAARLGRRGRGQVQRLVGHVLLAEAASSGDRLDGVAIAVPGREIHLPVEAAWVAAQGLLDEAHLLDEIPPVHDPQQAQAADAVADGDLIGGLLLVFGLHQVCHGLPHLGQALFDPAERQGKRRPAPLQAAHQLGHEGAGHRGLGAHHVGHHQDQALRVFLDGGGHPVGPGAGQHALGPTRGDQHPDPAEILDQGEPQHDRDGPQLAQLERRDGLVGGHEAAKALGIHPPVAVGHGFKGDVVNPRPPGCHPAAVEARKLPGVALGQQVTGAAGLLFDEIKIVEQPLAGRDHALLVGHRAGEQPAHLEQGVLVVIEPRQQTVGSGPAVGQAVRFGQHTAVLGHLFDAEQFGAQGRLCGEGFPWPRPLQPAQEARPDLAAALGQGHHRVAAARAGETAGKLRGWAGEVMGCLSDFRHAAADAGPKPLPGSASREESKGPGRTRSPPENPRDPGKILHAA